MNKNSKLVKTKWSKEEVEAYLSEKYPKGLPKSEQEIDREAAEKRKIEEGIDKLIDTIETRNKIKKIIEKVVENND